MNKVVLSVAGGRFLAEIALESENLGLYRLGIVKEFVHEREGCREAVQELGDLATRGHPESQLGAIDRIVLAFPVLVPSNAIILVEGFGTGHGQGQGQRE